MTDISSSDVSGADALEDDLPKSGGWRVEVLDEGDLGEVLTLQRAAFALEVIQSYPAYTQPLSQTLEELREEQSAPGAAVLGIKDGQRLIGAIRVIPESGATLALGRLSVAPDRTREGLGKALMEGAINFVVESRPEAQRLQFLADGDNEWLISWYKQLGFQVVVRGFPEAPGAWRLAMNLEAAARRQ